MDLSTVIRIKDEPVTEVKKELSFPPFGSTLLPSEIKKEPTPAVSESSSDEETPVLERMDYYRAPVYTTSESSSESSDDSNELIPEKRTRITSRAEDTSALLRDYRTLQNSRNGQSSSQSTSAPTIQPKNVGNSNNYKCSVEECPFRTNNPGGLRRHELNHRPRKTTKGLLICQHCSYKCTGSKGYTVHLLQHVNSGFTGKTFELSNISEPGSESSQSESDDDDKFEEPSFPADQPFVEYLKYDKNLRRCFYQCTECQFKHFHQTLFSRHLEKHKQDQDSENINKSETHKNTDRGEFQAYVKEKHNKSSEDLKEQGDSSSHLNTPNKVPVTSSSQLGNISIRITSNSTSQHNELIRATLFEEIRKSLESRQNKFTEVKNEPVDNNSEDLAETGKIVEKMSVDENVAVKIESGVEESIKLQSESIASNEDAVISNKTDETRIKEKDSFVKDPAKQENLTSLGKSDKSDSHNISPRETKEVSLILPLNEDKSITFDHQLLRRHNGQLEDQIPNPHNPENKNNISVDKCDAEHSITLKRKFAELEKSDEIIDGEIAPEFSEKVTSQVLVSDGNKSIENGVTVEHLAKKPNTERTNSGIDDDLCIRKEIEVNLEKSTTNLGETVAVNVESETSSPVISDAVKCDVNKMENISNEDAQDIELNNLSQEDNQNEEISTKNTVLSDTAVNTQPQAAFKVDREVPSFVNTISDSGSDKIENKVEIIENPSSVNFKILNDNSVESSKGVNVECVTQEHSTVEIGFHSKEIEDSDVTSKKSLDTNVTEPKNIKDVTDDFKVTTANKNIEEKIIESSSENSVASADIPTDPNQGIIIDRQANKESASPQITENNISKENVTQKVNININQIDINKETSEAVNMEETTDSLNGTSACNIDSEPHSTVNMKSSNGDNVEFKNVEAPNNSSIPSSEDLVENPVEVNEQALEKSAAPVKPLSHIIISSENSKSLSKMNNKNSLIVIYDIASEPPSAKLNEDKDIKEPQPSQEESRESFSKVGLENNMSGNNELLEIINTESVIFNDISSSELFASENLSDSNNKVELGQGATKDMEVLPHDTEVSKLSNAEISQKINSDLERDQIKQLNKSAPLEASIGEINKKIHRNEVNQTEIYVLTKDKNISATSNAESSYRMLGSSSSENDNIRSVTSGQSTKTTDNNKKSSTYLIDDAIAGPSNYKMEQTSTQSSSTLMPHVTLPKARKLRDYSNRHSGRGQIRKPDKTPSSIVVNGKKGKSSVAQVTLNGLNKELLNRTDAPWKRSYTRTPKKPATVSYNKTNIQTEQVLPNVESNLFIAELINEDLHQNFLNDSSDFYSMFDDLEDQRVAEDSQQHTQIKTNKSQQPEETVTNIFEDWIEECSFDVPVHANSDNSIIDLADGSNFIADTFETSYLLDNRDKDEIYLTDNWMKNHDVEYYETNTPETVTKSLSQQHTDKSMTQIQTVQESQNQKHTDETKKQTQNDHTITSSHIILDYATTIRDMSFREIESIQAETPDDPVTVTGKGLIPKKMVVINKSLNDKGLSSGVAEIRDHIDKAMRNCNSFVRVSYTGESKVVYQQERGTKNQRITIIHKKSTKKSPDTNLDTTSSNDEANLTKNAPFVEITPTLPQHRRENYTPIFPTPPVFTLKDKDRIGESRCSLCPAKITGGSVRLMQHLADHETAAKGIKCPCCTYKNSKSLIFNHLFVHAKVNGDTWGCPVCEEVKRSRTALNDHIKVTHLLDIFRRHDEVCPSKLHCKGRCRVL